MFIERNRLIQLNKDIFGGGINQTKKLVPDYGRVVMPDPSLPKIKKYNIRSNNPLGYLMNMNQQMPIQSQVQNIPSSQQEVVEQPEQDLYSQNMNEQEQIQEEENNNIIEEVPAQPQEEEPQVKKYAITDLGENNVLLPPGNSTNDEGEYKLLNLINEPKEKYKLAVETEHAKIYKREVSINLNDYIIININIYFNKQGENNIQILKSYGKLPFPLSRIRPVLRDTPGMDKWDKTFKKHEVIQKYPIENGVEREIDYFYIKMPVFMTDRELVQETKIWSEYNGNPKNMLVYQKSTTNPKYPVQEKPIRAEMIIGGSYLKEISPSETLIYLINNFDLKITTGKDLVDKAAPNAAKEFFPNLIKYIQNN